MHGSPCRDELLNDRRHAAAEVGRRPDVRDSHATRVALAVLAWLIVAAPAQANVFTGDFETGDLSQWTAVQRAAADRVRVVRAPGRPGCDAARFEVRHGDSVYGGARAELLWGDDARPTLHDGDNYYFGWSTYWARRFPSPSRSQGHSVFLQWKGTGTGSPPMEMSNRNERIALRTHNNDVWHVPLTRGRWHSFVAHVKFSADPAIGYVTIWHNGAYQGHYRMATLVSGKASYLKLGYYRNSAIRRTGVLYSGAMRVGHTLDQVTPW